MQAALRATEKRMQNAGGAESHKEEKRREENA